eukprot:CAMPEP_0114346222 /NCGR_PEP_ID=MMETSP0101-20121206/12879_1 /TAXON_ID=38822 ORGANISM="Pteridomonas danica, Strain PT" /NCGR_SAMPLE_ID=MMETSP0101 /ASSEMBLY_ACC=CAM_ASM_000211 /LENGTH=383 /DNA_ID=CAMNT_0001482705 /DNA_START=381 /DNA_END=1532 /DNA_ORIENTATION=+
MPWIAVFDKFPVWTGCGSPRSINGSHELISHMSLPATSQYNNIALISYHAPSRIAKLSVSSMVYAHFPINDFREAGFEVIVPLTHNTVDNHSSSSSSLLSSSSSSSSHIKWVFVRNGSSYLALGCDHLYYDARMDPPLQSLHEDCFWICIAINKTSHIGIDSFEHFQHLCREKITGNQNHNQLLVSCPSLLLNQDSFSSININQQEKEDQEEGINLKTKNDHDDNLTLVCKWHCGDSHWYPVSSNGGGGDDDDDFIVVDDHDDDFIVEIDKEEAIRGAAALEEGQEQKTINERIDQDTQYFSKLDEENKTIGNVAAEEVEEGAVSNEEEEEEEDDDDEDSDFVNVSSVSVSPHYNMDEDYENGEEERTQFNLLGKASLKSAFR